MVRILGSADSWLKDLPDNHGKLLLLSFTCTSQCERHVSMVPSSSANSLIWCENSLFRCEKGCTHNLNPLI